MARIDLVPTRTRSGRVGDFGQRAALRLRVLMSQWRLDHELASGVDPACRSDLALRAAQVVRPRHRRRLAASLKRVVDEADANRTVFSAALPVQCAQVRAARSALLSLADTLMAAESVRPRGVAMVWVLLIDRDSPIYASSARGGLLLKAETARDYLVDDERGDQSAALSGGAGAIGDGEAPPSVGGVAKRLTPSRRRRGVLFFAFAVAVMADPVSSVAYAIEAALRALGGHLNLLLPTMGLVIGLIALVTLNYWQLVRAFPEGGGSPEAAGRAFGQQWTFLPIGALVVDFALTIAISIAAAGSALVALAPAFGSARIPIDLALIAAVATLTWFGHGGRLIFAAMTSLFLVASIPVLALGWLDPHQAHGAAPITDSASPALVAVILAFPVAMALATGTEAPATSIAQLGQLDNRGRRRFGRGTLAVTIVIVGGLTMGLTALAVHLHVGIPSHDQTQISDLARAATGSGGLFGFFQVTSGLLLIAAAASSFQAGPGLLKALARTGPSGEEGLLPRSLGRTNHHHTPVAAVGVYAAVSAAILLAASGQEQELVLVYAVAVFVSFLAGLLAMARFSHRRGSRWLTLTNLAGALGVTFTLTVNLERGYPVLALAGTALVAAVLYWRWVRAGRPAGIEAIEREAEAEVSRIDP